MTKVRKAVIPAAGSPLQLTFSRVRQVADRLEGALSRGELLLNIYQVKENYD